MTNEIKIIHVTDDDGTVGYGMPPKHTRFQKGVSGNPRGRKRRAVTEEAHDPILTYMLEPMTVSLKGKRVKMTTVSVMVKTMINKALTGCIKTQKLLLDQCGGLKNIQKQHKLQVSSADKEFLRELRKEADKFAL